GKQDIDETKLGMYLADECSVRMEEAKPPFVGKAAAIGGFKAYIDRGLRFDVKTHDTFAKGTVVLNVRNDGVLMKGKPGGDIPVVGVFVLKDGKIKEWTDYVIPKQA